MRQRAPSGACSKTWHFLPNKPWPAAKSFSVSSPVVSALIAQKEAHLDAELIVLIVFAGEVTQHCGLNSRSSSAGHSVDLRFEFLPKDESPRRTKPRDARAQASCTEYKRAECRRDRQACRHSALPMDS